MTYLVQEIADICCKCDRGLDPLCTFVVGSPGRTPRTWNTGKIDKENVNVVVQMSGDSLVSTLR